MRELERIVDDLHRSIEGESWQGPSIREILEDISAADAASHPIAGAHSIWELVLHVTTWIRVADERVRGHVSERSGETNFPTVRDSSEGAWRAVHADLRKAEAELTQTLAGLADEDLDGPVPNRNYDRAHMLHGISQHNAYHAGQLSLLKRALETREGAAEA